MRTNRGRYQIKYRRRRSGFSFAAVLSFISERRFLFAGIAAAVVVVVVLFVTGVINPAAQTMAQASPTASAASSNGALSQSSATPSPSPSVSTGPLVGTTIGVSVLSPSLEDYTLMAYFDKEAQADKSAKQLNNFIMSNAKGDGKLQLTQVQSMIKSGANVIVVMGTASADFQKISDLCSQSKVQIVACNVDATQGFAVDVMSQANHALKFAQFAQKSNAGLIFTVGADTTEVNTINTVLSVNANIDSANASKNISDRLNAGTPVWDLMFFDNSANSVLKMYIKKGVLPNSIATPAYVGFIKTWYALLHDGVTVTPTPSASPSPSASSKPKTSASASPSPNSSASATPSSSASATAGSNVMKATPDKFHAIAYTKVQNLGEIVYQFALNLSAGRTLPQANYMYDTSGEEYITNDNIDSYYAKIGKLTDQDILPSIGDTGTVDALFK